MGIEQVMVREEDYKHTEFAPLSEICSTIIDCSHVRESSGSALDMGYFPWQPHVVTLGLFRLK